jgi:hypothetical protein
MAILLFVHLTRHSNTAAEQFELYFSGANTTTAAPSTMHACELICEQLCAWAIIQVGDSGGSNIEI